MKRLLTVVGAAAALLLMTSSPATAIVNGSVDTTHDYVGAIRGLDGGGTQRVCSGSLIGKGVFLTAGHCTRLQPGTVTVLFGDDIDDPDFVAPGTAIAHPEFNQSFGEQFDVGVVLFDQRRARLPVGQLAPENYVDGLTLDELRAATFQTLGYGQSRDETTGNSAPLTIDGLRRIADQTYKNKHNQFLGLSINNQQDNGGACNGDSGGPHLYDDAVLGELIVSVTSNGDASCVTSDNTQRVDQPEIRDWILSFVD